MAEVRPERILIHALKSYAPECFPYVCLYVEAMLFPAHFLHEFAFGPT